MITGRVLSARVVSVSLLDGGPSQDVAQRKDIRFSSHPLMPKQDVDKPREVGGLHIDSV